MVLGINTQRVNILAMNTLMHPLDRAVSCFPGGRAELARHLGVTPAAIGNWKRRGVPVEYCLAIERLTGGRVTRKELFAGWQKIWPDLAESEPNTPVAPTHQAPAAINTEAQGAAHA